MSGCAALVVSGRCAAHAYKAQTYGRPWRRVRDAHIHAHPWCVECLKTGVRRVAEEVDHIIPHGGDPVLMWDLQNLASLCRIHHQQKTGRELQQYR